MGTSFRFGILFLLSVILLTSRAYAEIQIELKNCEPKGLIASLREIIGSRSFWVDQKNQINAEIVEQQIWWAKAKRLQRDADRILSDAERTLKQTLDKIYADNPNIRRPTPSRSDQLQALVDEAKKQEHAQLVRNTYSEYLSRLRRCSNFIQTNYLN